MIEQVGPGETVVELAAKPQMQKALAWIEASSGHFVEELTAISQIAAPTFSEGPRGEHVARRLVALGAEQVRTDRAGNVIACVDGALPGPGPAIIAHLDTVFGSGVDVSVSRHIGRLYGPGIGDNGAGVTSLLFVLEALRVARIRPTHSLWLVASTGEEGLGDLRGVRAAMEGLAGRVDAVVAVEGSLLGRITHQAVGSRRWRVGFRGPGGHSWHEFGRPSAINGAGLAVAALAHLRVPGEPRTTLNVGRLEGGSGVNVIAADAFFLLDMRSIDASALVDLERRAEREIRQAAAEAGVDVEIETVGQRPAGGIDRASPLVQTAAAVLQHYGITPRYEAASTDANIPLSQGLPAITVGVTQGGGVHTEGEWIEIRPALDGICQLLLLTVALTGME